MKNIVLALAVMALATGFVVSSTYQADAYTQQEQRRDSEYKRNNEAAARAYK